MQRDVALLLAAADSCIAHHKSTVNDTVLHGHDIAKLNLQMTMNKYILIIVHILIIFDNRMCVITTCWYIEQ